MCLGNFLVLKTMMSSGAVLTLFLFLLQGVLATFPPVSNPPPIPSQPVRTLDNYQNYYFQDNLPPNPPQSDRDEEIYIPEPKLDDQRWYIPENQSGETGDYPTSSDTFDRYYSNGLPAVGPVATPLPDDAYVAQQSGTSQILPDGPPNIGASDIWVLAKGSDNQYIPERWVRIPAQNVVQVVNQDTNTKVAADALKSVPFSSGANTIKSIPPPPPPAIKSQFPPAEAPNPVAPPNAVRQIWIRRPSVVDSSKLFQDQPAFVDDFSSVKQVLDVPPPNIRQILQSQITKQLPLPPPQQQRVTVVAKKPAPLPLPPAPAPVQVPPPVPAKGVDQIVISSGSVAPIPDAASFVVGKDGSLQQMRHIWIPTSQQTGKFISVPVSSIVDGGKSVTAKGALADGSPVAVSDTWVLRQDGPLPRFEPQKSFPPVQNPVVAVPNANFAIGNPSVTPFDSPSPAIIGKSVNGPFDSWPVRNDVNSKVISKSGVAPIFTSKSGAIVLKNTSPDPSIVPQKSYTPNGKVFLPPPALPPPLPPVTPVAAPAAITKDKPCPITPQNYVQLSKSIQTPPAPSVITAIKRQPFSRIIRVNRYPFGSYYVLTSRLGSNFYAYPRPAAIIKQTKNGIIRLVPSYQAPPPLPAKQLPAPLPAKQISFPLTSKTSGPIIYPAAPAVTPIRYAYPWGGYLKSYPIPGRNVFPLPSLGSSLRKAGTLKATSVDSSSSESSSEEVVSRRSRKIEARKIEPRKSEAKKAESKKTEPKKPAQPEASSESTSEEKEVEKLEDRKSVESGEENETSEKAKSEEKSSEESEEDTSVPEIEFDTEESQISSLFQKVPLFQNPEGLKQLIKSYAFGYDQRDNGGTIQYRTEVADTQSTQGGVIGSYAYKEPNGIYRNAAYMAGSNGYRPKVASNEPDVTNFSSANINFEAEKSPETITNEAKVLEAISASTKENTTVDIPRD